MPLDDDRRLVELYDAHAPSVWRYVVHLTGDPVGADDIVQETLLRAWRSPRILAQEPASTRSWMFTVARNLVIDEARSARRRHEIGVAETFPSAAARTAPTPSSRACSSRRRSRGSTLEHRAVIVHAYYGGCSIAEVAPPARHPRGHREVAAALRATRPAACAAGEGGDAMNPDHPRFADWDSAYVLGALSPAERREYEEHLETCETVPSIVAELPPIPGLLARLVRRAGRGALVGGSRRGIRSAPATELLDAVRARPPPRHPSHAVLVGRGRRPPRRSPCSRRSRCRWPQPARRRARTRSPSRPSPTCRSRRPACSPRSTGARGSSSTAATSRGADATDAADVPEGGWPYALVVVDHDGNRTELSSWRAIARCDGAPDGRPRRSTSTTSRRSRSGRSPAARCSCAASRASRRTGEPFGPSSRVSDVAAHGGREHERRVFA